jgi:hypothetical protein
MSGVLRSAEHLFLKFAGANFQLEAFAEIALHVVFDDVEMARVRGKGFGLLGENRAVVGQRFVQGANVSFCRHMIDDMGKHLSKFFKGRLLCHRGMIPHRSLHGQCAADLLEYETANRRPHLGGRLAVPKSLIRPRRRTAMTATINPALDAGSRPPARADSEPPGNFWRLRLVLIRCNSLPAIDFRRTWAFGVIVLLEAEGYGTMEHEPDISIKQFCEDTLPTTGRRCGRTASITILRFGEQFNVCAECATRDYLRQRNGVAIGRASH